jgi:hypothetical protein
VTSILLCAIISISILLPIANATTPPKTWPTVAYLSVSPNKIGLGQQALLIMFIDKIHPLVTGFYGDRFTGYTINLTKPNGDTQILGPFTADPVSTSFTQYKPDQIGNYTAVFHFPAQLIKEVNPPPAYQSYNHPDQINDTYAESFSNEVTFTVTEELVPNWPDTPLPTDYWTRPIHARNRNWASIAGDWLSGAANPGPYRFDPYLTGPETAHVLWYDQYWLGGIGGGRADTSVYMGTPSGDRIGDPMIVNGIAIFRDRVASNTGFGWYAVDLYTGKRLYYVNSTTYPSFASKLNFITGHVTGTWSYLWSTSGSTWTAIDPFSGNEIFKITNVQTAGTAVYGKDGSILRYNIVGTGANKRLTVWNTTYVTSYTGPLDAPREPNQLTGSYNGSNGYSLNVSIPNVQGSIFEIVEDKWIIGGIAGKQNQTQTEQGHLWTISLERGKEGTLLSNVTFTPAKAIMDPYELYQYGPYGPSGWARTSTRMYDPFVYSEYGVFVFWEGATRQLWGFSLETGQMIWGPTEPQENVFMSYGMNPAAAYGIFYTGGDRGGGEVHAYNITTGESLWIHSPGVQHFEGGWSSQPTFITTVADGKVYVTGSEHTPTIPLKRDATMRILDAYTGKLLDEFVQYNGEVGSFALSSGYAIVSSIYDSRWYCIGKGPSATTVNASPKISVHGSSVLVEGYVTDQSPGAPDTPAIADEYQKTWMEYLYMQQPMPTDAKGVEVVISVLDPNNNMYEVGRTTSDTNGMFKLTFTPEVPGTYSVIAKFEGSKSYGSSLSETAISVDEAPPQPTQQPAVSPPPTEMYVLGTGVAIIIAIAILGILLLRKQP